MKKAFRVSSIAYLKTKDKTIDLPDIHFNSAKMAEIYIETMTEYIEEVGITFGGPSVDFLEPKEVEVDDQTNVMPDMPQEILAIAIVGMSMKALGDIEREFAKLN
jgi:hypothetical protein